jgi:hypothetical protein
VPHLLRHGTFVFKVISQRPVILASVFRARVEGAITTYFKRLRFDVAGTGGAELRTSRLLSECTTTGVRQPLIYKLCICVVNISSFELLMHDLLYVF